jgi:hypothetical protein
LIHDLRLFVIDGAISLPIVVAGFFLFPDFPHNTHTWYINENVRVNFIHCAAFSDIRAFLGQGDCQNSSAVGRSSAETAFFKSESPQDL